MTDDVWLLVGIGVFLAVLTAYVLLYRRVRSRRVGVAAVGMVYDLLQEDRRKAVEIIVEEKAEATEPETSDGQPTR